LVFLNSQTNNLTVEPLKTKDVFLHLGNNVYRKQWIVGMKKQIPQFQLISSISQAVPAYLAHRPKSGDSFQAFSDAIEQQVIHQINGISK
jgi:hypothetical protein